MRAVETLEEKDFELAQKMEDEIVLPDELFVFDADANNVIFKYDADFEKLCARMELKGFAGAKYKTVIEFEGAIEALTENQKKK